jgi:ATP-binding cassette subfamily F protein uup
VEQEPYTSSQVTVADAILGIRAAADNAAAAAGNSVYAAVHAYRCAVDQAESDPQAFAAACAEMDAHSGSWDVWTKMEEVATKLRIRHLQNEPLSNLSGGERKRGRVSEQKNVYLDRLYSQPAQHHHSHVFPLAGSVSLAAALVLEPDVLLLDEPSNWLSLAGVQWLTDLLLKYDKKLTILMVTHDRIFLDQVCDRILELDQGSLYEYVDCDYAGYLQAKEERLALQDATAQSARASKR